MLFLYGNTLLHSTIVIVIILTIRYCTVVYYSGDMELVSKIIFRGYIKIGVAQIFILFYIREINVMCIARGIFFTFVWVHCSLRTRCYVIGDMIHSIRRVYFYPR